MVIQEKSEIQKLLEGSRRVLIVTKDNPGFDEIGTALAWHEWLSRRNHEHVDVSFTAPNRNRFKFMPGFDAASEVIRSADEFVIRVNVAKTKARELSYDVKGDVLEIIVKPEGGNFSSRDVSFAETKFGYDVIMTIGAAELSSIGKLFEDNRELFYGTPIINIDTKIRNTRYGQLNVVYATATSLAEITYACIDELTAATATNLLTGLIYATNSFQTPQVTPDTLKLAGDLIVAGAKRAEIVDHLFRTKDMDKLKVWGRVLSRLQQVEKKIVYSDLRSEDIEGKEIDLATLVDDLVLASPEADIVLFFFEKQDSATDVYVYGRENFDLPVLLQPFSPKGDRRHVLCALKTDRAEAERQVIAHLKDKLKLINQ